ncbi:MAG TPA: 2-octaprenyl-6-methoxyphenyl hydroxylase, partial [Rhodospirillales bacterium]|nr:2-octaprenyl-6-methoxyphenyl hydroxylase [Rhodospirillales bacterium]
GVVERDSYARMLTAPYDGRVTAIARGSKLLLDALGVWPAILPHAEPIREILVAEAGSPVEVRYDSMELDGEPLGWIVENRRIREGLLARVRELPGIRLFDGEEVAGIRRDAFAARLELASGRRLAAPLLAVCEGRLSRSRARLGIGARRWDYGQTGIVCTLRHERPHGGVAVERFFPDGPFAVLPMPGDRSSIVWALEDGLAAAMRELDDAAFAAEVEERFGDRLGAVSLEGPRWYYPLVLVWSERYTDWRVALVGDTARGIHPIAGQGWNLALRDVAAVAETVVERLRLGLDPGEPAALEAYEAWRRFDSLALVAVTDGINRLFANDVLPLRLARNVGLALVERLPPAKRFFMRHAMGMVGHLPRLMRGEPL